MCTHPVTITRSYPLIGSRTITVPCGKCEECISKKRSELAALSVHQALVSGSLHFFTLTYNNDQLPVAIFDPSFDKVVGFYRARGAKPWLDSEGRFMNRFLPDKKRKILLTPSLCREDVKKWLKLFRVRWQRKKGTPLNFKYCGFGEYGDRHGRPHYHFLLYGLSQEQADFAASIWSERFGFVGLVPQVYRKLSSEEIGAVSSYVSKYTSKGICQLFAHLLPFVERPRRQSSLDFGQFSEDELLRYSRFMMDAISSNMMNLDISSELLPLMIYLYSLIEGNLFRLMVQHTHSLSV